MRKFQPFSLHLPLTSEENEVSSLQQQPLPSNEVQWTALCIFQLQK